MRADSSPTSCSSFDVGISRSPRLPLSLCESIHRFPEFWLHMSFQNWTACRWPQWRSVPSVHLHLMCIVKGTATKHTILMRWVGKVLKPCDYLQKKSAFPNVPIDHHTKRPKGEQKSSVFNSRKGAYRERMAGKPKDMGAQLHGSQPLPA